MKTIKLLDFWTSLISRDNAKVVFSIAKQDDFRVIFDAQWVWFISTSFSDELFAKGKNQFGMVFKISNIKNDLIKSWIKESLITRDEFTTT